MSNPCSKEKCDMKFSFLKTDDARQHLTLRTPEWFMNRILRDTKTCSVVTFREQVSYSYDPRLLPLYSQLTRVCPLAELRKTTNGRLEVVTFNGLVWLHVAGLLRPEDIEAVKESTKTLPTTFAAFLGADGRSVEILVSVTPKAAVTLQTEAEITLFCQTAYEVASGIYDGILPRPVERQAVTLHDGFLMTLDPQPYYNPDATPIVVSDRQHPLPPLSDDMPTDQQLDMDMDLYGDYELMYGRAVEMTLSDLTASGRSEHPNTYISLLAHHLCQTGMPEEEAFLHLHNHHVFRSDYNENTFRAIVTAVYAEEKSKHHDEEAMVSAETRRLIQFLTTRYVFRYNTVMGYTEYRPNNTWVVDWQPCDENAINGIALQARLANLDVKEKDVRRYVHSNMIRRCDPVNDFLFRVSSKWDGHTDHIAMLARCVPCDMPEWETLFKKWFVAMVAQWMLPTQEYGNAIVPLLISAQGDGKSTFCRMILPKELSWGFLDNLDVSEKRTTLQAMHNFLLINLDEFNQISPKQQEGFLKNIIQLPSVKIKRPYGRHVEEFKRNASFIATTNDVNVLSDPTGSRRFICVNLTAPIRTDYKPNYEALYGQAYTLVMEKRIKWYLEPDEVKAVMTHNQAFQVLPPAIQFFLDHFDIVQSEEEGGTWITSTAIYQRLRQLVGSSLTVTGVNRFGRILCNMEGLRRKRTKTGIYYLVREKPTFPPRKNHSFS